MPKKNSGKAKAAAKAKASGLGKVDRPTIDKTFGLKNKKKSKKVQNYMKVVRQQDSLAGKSRQQLKDEKSQERLRKRKKEAAEREAMVGSLFKAVVSTSIVPKGVDPKSVLCPHFKTGKCKFGKKCKYSHDQAVERKSAKISLYVDQRKDTMDTWDQDKLEKVLAHKERGRVPPNETSIVCKHFITAVEQLKYGWLWKCPNGVLCKYKHALPPGFKLKGDGPKEDTGPKVSVEDRIEKERAKLDLTACTPVSLDLFMAWKEKKKEERSKMVMQKVAKQKSKKTGSYNALSGRDLFTYDPSVFVDDASAAAADDYDADEEPEEKVKKVNVAEQVIAEQKQKQKDKAEAEAAAEAEAEAAQPTEKKTKKKKKKKPKKKKKAASKKDTDAPAPSPAPAPAAAPGGGAIDEALFMDDDDLPDE